MCRSELYALVKTELLENECEHKVEPKEWTYGSNLKIKKYLKKQLKTITNNTTI